MDGEGAEDNKERASRDGLILGASGRGWPSCPLPETPKDAWLPLLAAPHPPPVWPEERTSGTCLCVRQGLRVSDASTRSVSLGRCCPLPQQRFALCATFPFVFYIELMCGFLPAQQSFLGFSNSLGMCPVKPHGPSCRGIPPTAPPLVQRGARRVEPPDSPSTRSPSQGHLLPSRLWVETIPVVWLCLWGLFLLFLIFAVRRGDSMSDMAGAHHISQ